ncbi:MAG: BatD family protein [Bdellovibrionales bacterium]|nr:BatD family protein [Bdellovibrionales bacterium]
MVIAHIHFKIFILLICGWAYTSHAVSVKANVSQDIVGVSQPFYLNITISSEEDVDIETPVLPNMSPFIVQGSNQSTSIAYSFSMPGGQTKTVENKISYTLMSDKKGEWTIGPISVKVDGKIYKTEELKVEISNQAPSPSPPSSIFNHPLLPKIFQDEEAFPFSMPKILGEDEFILKPDRNKRIVYLGQGVPVQWFLYKKSRHSFAVNIQPHENMQPEHFWTEKVNDPSVAQFTETETINDHEYFRALAASYIFFPLKEGELKIDPLKLTVTTTFSGFFSRKRPNVLTSPPISIKVLPLPQQGRGEFTGAVGRFFIFPKVDRKQILKDDILSYKILFEGDGNIRMIQLPSWPEDSDFKVYDVLESGEFSSEKSYKEYEVLLSAKNSGLLKTPRLNWTTFDPDLKSYVNHELEPVEIRVQEEDSVQGEEQKFFDSTTSSRSEKKEDVLSPLPENVSIYEKNKYLFWSFVYTLLALMIFWRHKSFFIRKKKVSWAFILNQTFNQAQKSLTEGQYRRVGTLLLNLIDQVWLKVTGTGGRELEKLLKKCPPSLRKDLGEEVTNLVKELEDLSFAERPESSDPWIHEKVEALMKKSKTTIEKVLRYS